MSIYTFSGPRGVGKTTIMDGLRDDHGVEPIVPFTTRDPRPGEVDGQDYHFVTAQEFKSLRDSRGGMFDVLTLGETNYGTPRSVLSEAVESSSPRSFNVAPHTALRLRAEMGRSTINSIYLIPASWNDIERQMREAGISEEEIIRRRSAEPADLSLLPEFDRIVVNECGQLQRTVELLAGYIRGQTRADDHRSTLMA